MMALLRPILRTLWLASGRLLLAIGAAWSFGALPFPELKRRSHINGRARAADRD
jgi:hypothetical protein